MQDQQPPIEAVATPITPIGDCAKVERVVLPYLKRFETDALRQTAQFHQSVEADESDYRGKGRNTGNVRDMGREVEVREAANQVNIVTALYHETFFQSSEGWRAQAINGELQSRADATKSIMDANHAEYDFSQQVMTFFHRFTKFDMAGMKVCLTYDTVLENLEFDAPSQLAEILQGMFDEQGHPLHPLGPTDLMPDGSYSTIRFETPDVKSKANISIRALEMRNIAVSDMKRNAQSQPSIHEFHFLNEDELHDNGTFRDLDKLGRPNAPNRHHPATIGGMSYTTGINTTPANTPQWMITETHCRIPFTKWLAGGKFQMADLEAFAQKYGFDVAEGYIPQIFISWHKGQEWLGKLNPTYSPDRKKHVYFFESFIPGDGELVGQGFLRQIKPMSEWLNQLYNMTFDNLRQRGSLAVLLNSLSPLDATDLERLRTDPSAVVQIEMNASADIARDVRFLCEIMPDITGPLTNAIVLAQNRTQVDGAPAIIQGTGQADTATQDMVNNQRGQQKLDGPLRRAVFNVIVPCLELERDLTLMHFDGPRLIGEIGEAGTELTQGRWVNRAQISNRFRIVPTASFDFMNRQAKAQQLLMGLNIIASIATPEILMKNYGLFLESVGFDRTVVNNLTGQAGANTNPDQEIQVMVFNPDEPMETRVRPDDDHFACLEAAQYALQKYPQLEQQYHFNEYRQRHLRYMVIQEAQQAMAAQQQGGAEEQGEPGDGRKGPPVQPNPNPAMNDQGQTRAIAQHNSPPDGGKSSAGMTGRASPAMAAATGAGHV